MARNPEKSEYSLSQRVLGTVPQIIIVIPNTETLHSYIKVLWTLWVFSPLTAKRRWLPPHDPGASSELLFQQKLVIRKG